MLAAMLGTLMPSTLLSGMIFPIDSMPTLLVILSNIIPARWFVVIVRGIMLKGVGLNYLWKETLVLCAMTLILMAAAVRSFKPRLG
jgi:ABC-2 type transport system permease protein